MGGGQTRNATTMQLLHHRTLSKREPALDAVPLDRIRKFLRKARDYLEIYRNGISAVNEVKEALKKYK